MLSQELRAAHEKLARALGFQPGQNSIAPVGPTRTWRDLALQMGQACSKAFTSSCVGKIATQQNRDTKKKKNNLWQLACDLHSPSLGIAQELHNFRAKALQAATNRSLPNEIAFGVPAQGTLCIYVTWGPHIWICPLQWQRSGLALCS